MRITHVILLLIASVTIGCSQYDSITANNFSIQKDSDSSFVIVGSRDIALTYGIFSLDTIKDNLMINGVSYVDQINYDGFTDKYLCGEPEVEVCIGELDDSKIKCLTVLAKSNQQGEFKLEFDMKGKESNYLLFVDKSNLISKAFKISWFLQSAGKYKIEKERFKCNR
jgi:hypothetical protein